MPREKTPGARSFPSQTHLLTAGAVLLEALFLYIRRLDNLELHVVEFIAAGLAAGLIYLLAVWALEHTRDTSGAWWLLVAAAILFRVTLWPLVPALSNDLYRYRWDGRAQLAGRNPYFAKPNDPDLQALRDPANHQEMRMPGPESPTIYPPLAELVFRSAARFLPSTLAFKLPMELADILTMILLAVWLRTDGGRLYQLSIYAWNPLVVVEFAGSGHSDALALAALVAAFVIIRSRRTVSTLLLAAAVLLKGFPILLFPHWLRRAGWPRTWRSWADGFAAAVLAALCAWPFRGAAHQVPITMAYFESRWQDNNASLYSLLKLFSHSHEFAAGLGVGIAVGLALWSAGRNVEPARAAFWIFGAVLLFSPNAYPWYFTWVIPFLCWNPNFAWLLLTSLQFLSYHVLINYAALGRWHFDPFYLSLTYAPFYALLIWQTARHRRNEPVLAET